MIYFIMFNRCVYCVKSCVKNRLNSKPLSKNKEIHVAVKVSQSAKKVKK